LLAQDRIQADLYTKQSSGQWLLSSFDHPEDTIDLDSTGVRLSLAECYEKVDFNA
jgi:hypothetical protein